MNESNEDSSTDEDNFFFLQGGVEDKYEAREVRLLCAAQTQCKYRDKNMEKEENQQSKDVFVQAHIFLQYL